MTDFFEACRAGDLNRLRQLLGSDPELVRRRNESGATGLHLALMHPDAVRLLLQHGADPNLRENGDNALPLHFAAGMAPLESVRLLLEAGSDVHGEGDLHQLEPIGWATVFAEARHDVVDLLVRHGARHHIFSAIASGDLEAIREVVKADPQAIHRRLSRFEQEQTALHYVVAPADGLVGGRFRTGSHYATLELLIQLGADLEALDAKGRTPLERAMLKGDRKAMRILADGGARIPESSGETEPASAAELNASVGKVSPMLRVASMEAAVEWYRSIGFELAGSHGDDGRLDWAAVKMGEVEIMFVPAPEGREQPTAGMSLWIRTDRLDQLYRMLRQRQMKWARAVIQGGETGPGEVRFRSDLYTAFYGQREFSVLDPDGMELNFFQPLE